MQALAQFGSLPAGVDLIVMRQEKVSAAKVAATAAKVSAAVAAPHISSPAPPSAGPPSPSASQQPSSPPAPAQPPAPPPVSSVTPADALLALQSATAEAAAAAIAYYQDVEFAAQLCDNFATQQGSNQDLYVPLRQASVTLQRIVATKSPSTPSTAAILVALTDAQAIWQADPGLKLARRRIKDADDKQEESLRRQLQDVLSQAEKEREQSLQRMQADEDDARSTAAAMIRLLEQQLGVDAAQINRMKDEESRALAAQDFQRAQEANARAKAYVVECDQRVQAASSQRNLQLQEQLLQLSTAARDAAAAAEKRVAAKRSSSEAALSNLLAAAAQRLKDCDAMAASFFSIIARAQELLARQPAWPRHEALLRFDLPLQRLTTHFVFSKKWFPRNFSLRGIRLYYSDGKDGHPDTAQGTLAFMQSNPAPDGRYCVDLQGTRALLADLMHPCVTLLLRLQRGRLQRGGRRAGLRLRDQVPCRAEGACVVSQLVCAHHAECCRVRRTCASLPPTTSRASAACASSKLRAQAPPHCRTSRRRRLSRQA